MSARAPHRIAGSMGACIAALLLSVSPAGARQADVAGQPAGNAQQAPPPTSDMSPNAWRWHVDANAFFGFNYQRRKFRDFSAWESQNWLMAAAERPAGRGRFVVSGMLSLEPVTLRDIGSPQAFQTGETYRLAPLIDYQHPHDLIMGLGAEYAHPVKRASFVVGADLVGSPSLGPPAFMHRPTGRDNPQAPLAHHYMDSTHITPGVLRAGVAAGEWRLEASTFRGREPDEDRLDIDLGALDSQALRLSWTHQSWSAQVSGARLEEPELTTPYDATRLTASIAYTPGTERGVAWFGAFGQNREIHGNLEAYLFEATIPTSSGARLYTRIESVAKDILDAGFHPRGVFHRHRQSQVSAFTIGYLHNLLTTAAGTYAVGADVTGYTVPQNLTDAYGSPVSFHVFLRYRAPAPAPGAPVHVH